ncbi:hypothetical protein [Arthrobacter sp. M4]|uniref:hypothetical protein n=1 Tax=Arthrobacter sp. M4 TaxID=218160 RepID=UPI001CDB9686|nr:hypothetical protein [Arthrobacter sp. M4]MCA4131902.1 hypothetical protein [Arthrobacter sp. M4]
MNPDEELRLVRLREGTHRPASKENPGYDRDLLRDNDGHLLGPTESRPVNIDEIIRTHVPPRPTIAQQIAGQVVSDIMEALRPHVMDAVDAAVDNKLGVPQLVKWITSKAAQRKADRNSNSTSTGLQQDVAPVDGIADETGTLEVRKLSVTSEQYQALQILALEAEQRAAYMRQLLANVEVRDSAIPLEGGASAVLEVTASSLDEATLRSAVAQLVDGGLTVEGEFILARNQGTDDRLRTIDEQPVEAKPLPSP